MVDDSERTDGIASLEMARNRLEAALSANSAWQALQADVSDRRRAQHEQELAEDPVYKSWMLVGEAIANLRAVESDRGVVDKEVAPAPQRHIAAVRDDAAEAPPREIERAEVAESDPADVRVQDAHAPDAPATSSLRAIDGSAVGDDEPDESAVAQDGERGDDLTQIHGIDEMTARSLAVLGVTRYAQIASWRRDDVSAVAAVLGLTREISQQNWIEQAALLERRAHPGQAAEIAATPPPIAAQPDEPLPSQRPDVVPADDPSTIVSASDDRVLPAGDRSQPVPERDIDLPDILEAIRRDASAGGSQPSVVTQEEELFAAEAAVDAPAEAGQPPAGESSGIAEDEVREPGVTPALLGPGATAAKNPEPAAAAEPAVLPRSRIPTVAASSHVNTDAAERARRLEQERTRLQQLGAGSRADLETEAAVTFVVREPVGGSQVAREGAPARQQHDRPEVAQYVPPRDAVEEAEVVVIGPGVRPSPGPADRDAKSGSMRRLFRAIKGG